MSDSTDQSLGRYHILEQIGEGGMAVVYRAQDIQLNRIVAVKVIRSEKADSEHFRQRFELEAKILAKLSHPHIVQVLDYGEYESQAYLVMDYISGGSLLAKMKGPMGWQEASRLLAPIARALEYAHTQNVIHRDVKPSNILLSDSGEPLLTDFGIAKILGTQGLVNLTVTGKMVGSPEYMAPEQGMGKEVDYRVDIYALGTVFYQMVTGSLPYHEDTPMATLMKKVEAVPVRPCELNKGLPKVVEQVILKAMERQPENRFQNMGIFAEILEQLAQGDTAASKGISELGERKQKVVYVWRWALGIISTLILLLAAWSLWGGRKEASSLASMFIPRPSPTFTVTPQIPTATNTSTYTATFTVVATSTPTETMTLTPTPKYLTISSTNINQLVKLQTFDTGQISYVGKTAVIPFAFSANGDFLGIKQGDKIVILNTDNWEQVLSLEGTPPVAFSPDGAQIITSGGMLRLWNTTDGSLVNKLEGMSDISQILFSNDSKFMATGDFGQVWLWRASDGKLLKTFSGAALFAFSPDSKILATASQNLDLFDIKDCENAGQDCGANLRNFSTNLTSGERTIAFSPDGTMVWYMARLWRVNDGKLLLVSTASSGATFSPDGKIFAVGLPSQVIQLYDTATMQLYPNQIYGSIAPYGYFNQGDIFLSNSSAFVLQRKLKYIFTNINDGTPIYTFDQSNAVLITISHDGRFVAILSIDTKNNGSSLEIWGIRP